MRIKGLTLPVEGPAARTAADKSHPACPTAASPRKTRPTPPLQPHIREKTRPASVKTPVLGCFERAGRTFSRTRRDNMATLKPTTPLRAPEQQPLKPPSPLRPKTAPKTPISHPQRRWRFQSHTSTSEQRRWRFQTTAPPVLQCPASAPVGGGEARPGDRWATSVTNVVKPEQFEAPCEDCCYKRRQSASKNHYFQRKSRRIDDVCNNGSENHSKNTSD